MEFANLQVFGTVGNLISCIVSTVIIFHFLDMQYERIYDKRRLYLLIKVFVSAVNFLLFHLQNPIVNMSYWLLVILLSSRLLYCNENKKILTYYMFNMSFLLAYALCEAVGGILVELGIHVLDIQQEAWVISFVSIMSSSLTIILLYHLVLRRLFMKEKRKKISTIQYLIYANIAGYVLINIGSSLLLLQYELSPKDYAFLLLDALLVIAINLYVFYLLDIFAENKDLKYKLALYEKQAKSNYDYYAKQMESNRKALSVIHDIRKHIRVLEELKTEQVTEQLQEYSDSFEEMILPLIVKQYSDSAILNIIINDKAEECEKKGISFNIDIQPVNLDYMQSIDITTIFGNILDNAIEACEKAEEKEIRLRIYPFNGLIYVELSNTFRVPIHMGKSGRPQSIKGEGHGIGLENVENALRQYNGDIQYTIEDGYFKVEIMFSR